MNIPQTILSVLIAILAFTAGYLMDNPVKSEPSGYDYEIITTQKGYEIFQDGRPVGSSNWNESSKFDSIVIADNL